LANYFKTSARSLVRNRLFSSINIFGLAISMSIGILMITYISQLMNFDEFHKNKAQVYKLYSNYKDIPDGSNLDLYSTSVYMGDKLKGEYPGIEKVLIMQGGASKDFTYEKKTLQLDGKYASQPFFEFFSFELLKGNVHSALEEPFSLVLSESAAKKFFSDTDPLNKTFTSGEDTYTVTGVMKDPPSNTHFGKFEMIESFATKRLKGKESKGFISWGNIWNYHVYLMLDAVTSEETVQDYLNQIAKNENADRDSYSIEFYLKNLSDISPGNGQSNSIGGAYIDWEDVNKLIFLTIIILASSCFNYTNLSIARSLRRAKEIGVRKVVGARYGQVFFQFIFEAILISLISIILAYAIYLLIKPGFEREVVDFEDIKLVFQGSHIVYFLLFAITIGVIAGIAPALVLSKLKAASILKDVSKVRLFKGMTLRKILIVLQFAVSMALIISATISYRQYVFAINHDMGFRTENILNINLYKTNADIDALKNEFAKIPEVRGISTSQMIPGTQSMYGAEINYKQDSLHIFYNKVDNEYLKIHDIEFLVGGGFLRKRKDSIGYIVIDEEVRKQLGFEKPEDALGEIVEYNRDGWKLEITGVLKDYEYSDLQNSIEPTVLIQSYDDRVYHMNLLVESGDMISLMNKLEGAWKKVDEVHTFNAEFYDQQVQNSYAEYKTMFRLFSFLSILAILISTMGLLGIAVFTTETRMKEISVRKVLGATERNLVILLARSFLFMLLISAAIAIPFSYYLFDQHILIDFRERITIGYVELAPGILIILIIALSAVVWQTIKAAKTNPADMLRSE
ncbi:MAG: ABC transporter permease, partial [Ekhidna sp.]